ncbi:MAG: hypothetical protein JXB49_17570 [Bacteroidales bacterium]|nr:hypothetical protein [Bacteroidales bacterium]
MGKKPDDFEDVVKFIASKLQGKQYAIRGTASLVLQGFDFNVQDIDVLTDKETALFCNDALKEILSEKVKYSETDKYKSYYGKFSINNILIEVCGDWQIKDTNGKWSEPFDASDDEVTEVTVGSQKVKVTSVETELKTYILTGRWNVYHKLRRLLDSKNQDGLF